MDGSSELYEGSIKAGKNGEKKKNLVTFLEVTSDPQLYNQCVGFVFKANCIRVLPM